LVEADRRTPIRQPPVRVDHNAWIKWLPDHAEIIRALPALLDRDAVSAFVADCGENDAGAVAAFTASQVWGYGTTGYGPFRLAEALAPRGTPAILRAALAELRVGSPVNAFRVLCVENEIPWTGTSFGSKFLYFADPTGRALILDRVVAGWLKEHAGVRLRLLRDEREYASWLRLTDHWSQQLGVWPDRLELIIFSDALNEDSSWKPESAGSTSDTRTVARERLTCADAIAAVLADAPAPLRASEVAEMINQRGLYRRGDGQPLPPYQVDSIARANTRRFVIQRGLITLAKETGSNDATTGGGRRSQSGGAEPPSAMPDPSVAPVAVLVGCVSHKEPTARPAKDLYRSQLFAGRRTYAQATGLPWLIVSAHYGLIEPDQVIEPYDRRLSDLDLAARRALAERIAEQLERRFGPLSGLTFEVHAGDEYMQMLLNGLRPRGGRIVNPLKGLPIGEQLKWYKARNDPSAAPPTLTNASASTPRHTPSPAPYGVDGLAPVVKHPGLAQRITDAFDHGELDLSLRPGAPAVGWAGMPEVAVAGRLRDQGATDTEVRTFITLAAAMDRARDADVLWFAAARLFADVPWTFDPGQIVAHSLTELADLLRRFRVSQRHGPDAAAWRIIAESLNDPDAGGVVRLAVRDGRGDARDLLDGLEARSPGGTDRFPFLRGPKVGPMWVRMIAYPGAANITSLEILPVAVDVQVRKVTEYLSVTDTGELKLDICRPIIQAAWAKDVADNGAAGPGELAGTAAALDPALWFWAKWGCTYCERNRRRLPIGSSCDCCRFPTRA
jgi:hypothetical protein